MKKNNGIKIFALGALIGAGVGMLFAPKKGSELRRDLKNKLDELVNKARSITKDDVKKAIEDKVKDIQASIDDLSSEKVLKSAKSKAKKLEEKVHELSKFVAEKSVPALDKSISAIQKRTDDVVNDVLKKLEKK